MKITTSQLRRIIKEEVQKALLETRDPEVLGPSSPDAGPPCDHCGSDNTTLEEPMPSMAGYGSDQSWTCNDCGETSFSTPSL